LIKWDSNIDLSLLTICTVETCNLILTKCFIYQMMHKRVALKEY
jgi:hypothetical protein